MSLLTDGPLVSKFAPTIQNKTFCLLRRSESAIDRQQNIRRYASGYLPTSNCRMLLGVAIPQWHLVKLG
jgi:hypothetical protein